MKRWVLILSGVIFVAAAYWGLVRIGSSPGHAASEQPKKPKPLVVTQAAQKGEIANTFELTGSVEPTRVARLASPAEGPVSDARIREGDVVRAGQKLLSIGRKRATEAMLASAEQDLKTEMDELGRIEKLVESGAIPKDQLQLARAKHARMVAQLEKMKESSADYDIEAPWDGIISKVLVADGNYVAARTVLVEMFDPNSLVVRTAVPEAQSQDVGPDMEVSVKLDAYGGKSFQAKVVRVYPELDRRMRTRIAEIEIVDDTRLVPGMFARLGLKLKAEQDAVVVPSEAVVVTPKGVRVAYVIEDSTAVQRKVITGIESAGRVQIVSGVQPGEQIVVAGNEKLKDGLEVRLQGDKDQGADKPKSKGDVANGGAGR